MVSSSSKVSLAFEHRQQIQCIVQTGGGGSEINSNECGTELEDWVDCGG